MVAVYVPPINVSGEDVANVLAAVGEQSDKPLVSSFLGAEGVPELLRVPDVAGSTAGRGSVPSYPGVEAAVRALARVVEYAVWLRTPDGAGDPSRARSTRPARSGWSTTLLVEHPEGTDLELEPLTELLAAYGIELWQTRAVTSLRGGGRQPVRTLGWDVVLKATADHLRERPDQAHVWRNIDNAEEMADAWAVAQRADH